MATDGQIVMNDKFYDKFVDIIGKVLLPEDELSLEDRLDQTPTFKNGVFYVASELSTGYNGVWKLTNCVANEQFLCLFTDDLIAIKQSGGKEESCIMEAVVDGRTFGLISSLLALGILWYIAGSRKSMDASLYSKAADSLECGLRETTEYFLTGDGRKDITQNEFREIENMSTVVFEFAKYKYEV